MTNSVNPLVSIIICNYNHGTYLRKAIDSALHQSYKRTEVIVVDDGSTDDSPSIISSYKNEIRSAFQENGGQCAAYNLGFSLSSGEYLIFLDADDWLSENCTYKVIQKFLEMSAAKVQWKLKIVDEDGVDCGNSVPRRLSDGSFKDRLLKYGFLHSAPPASGNAFRRTAVEFLFPLPIIQSDRHGADFFTIFGASFSGNVASLDENLGFYRVLRLSGSSNPILGNAANFRNELKKQLSRSERLVQLMRTRRDAEIPLPLVSYPLLKQEAGINALSAPTYLEKIRLNSKVIGNMVRIYSCDSERPALERILLMLWAVVITLSPWRLHRLIRALCNPAARGSA